LAENADFNESLIRDGESQRLHGLIAIETSGRCGSVASCCQNQEPTLITLEPSLRTAVTITPAIESILTHWRSSDIPVTAVAVSAGPGSFTGLRIGVTTAKALAYASKCPVIGVDTLAALAGVVFRLRPEVRTAWVAMNAYRQQCFVAKWDRTAWEQAFVDDTHATASQIWPVEQWWNQTAAASGDDSIAFASDPGLMSAGLHSGRRFDKHVAIEIDATDVAAMAVRLATQGHTVAPMNFRPNYLRDSAAEEKLR